MASPHCCCSRVLPHQPAAHRWPAAASPLWPLLLGLGWLVLMLLWGPAGVGSVRHTIDAEVYRGGAAAFWGGADLYSLSVPTAEGPLPFTYPPAAAMLFAPLLWVPPAWVGVVMTVLSAACWWLVWALVFAGESRALRAWAWCVSLLSFPLVATWSLGQINVVLWALVLLGVCAGATAGVGRRPGWVTHLPAGVGVGVAAAIKLTPLVFVLLCVARPQRRLCAGMAAGFFAVTGLAWALRPGASVEFFLRTMADASRVGDVAFAANLSVRGVLARAGGPAWAQGWWLVACALVLLLVAWALLRTECVWLQVVVVAAAGVLLSPVSWDHHWVWAPVAVVVLWRHHLRAVAVWGALLCALPPQPWAGAAPWLGQVWGAHAALWALVVVVVVGVSSARWRGR